MNQKTYSKIKCHFMKSIVNIKKKTFSCKIGMHLAKAVLTVYDFLIIRRTKL